MNHHIHDKLFTSSYILACVGNFLLFFGFYILLPVLPLYLIETFDLPESAIGIVLACYTLAALFIRPFTAYFADLFDRKPLYLMAYFLFIAVFISYPLVGTVGLFLLMRVLHGLAFGTVTTTGNTLIIDIMPASRRGEGLGYFGMANNLAMAIGPMTGLFIHDVVIGFDMIFYTAILSGGLGFCCASFIKAPKKQLKESANEHLSLDRFFLLKGMRAGVCLFFLAIPYGITTTYVALYGREVGIVNGMGVFFSLMAVGLIISRLFSGKLVDRGKLTNIILAGSIICTCTFFLFSFMPEIERFNHSLVPVTFYLVALSMGLGYGMMFPAYNTLFVNLAANNRRATASSTYLTSWDIGIGAGLVFGGYIAEHIGFSEAYLFGAAFSLLSCIIFKKWTVPHFNQHKLR
jgi:MFS family permease